MSLPDSFFAPVTLDPSTPVQLKDLPLTVTRFKKLYDTEPQPWEGLASKLMNARHSALLQKKAAAAFSPVVYPAGATRSKDSVLAVTALVLDFDHVTASVAEAVRQQLRGRASVLYTRAGPPAGATVRTARREAAPTLLLSRDPVPVAADARR